MIDRQRMGEGLQTGVGDGQVGREPGEEDAALHVDGAAQPAKRVSTHLPGNLIGSTIGRYLVEEQFGGGAMASVYRAHDQVLDQKVAIKVLLPGADSVMQARFRREARMVSTLVHPHIVRTLQVGRSSGIIYIAMELVEGASLADLLERHGRLTVGDAARLLAPVAEALAYAHARGIIHRDVKPSNILLQRADAGNEYSVRIGLLPYPVIPLLSDFGIARVLDAPELTNAGRTIGTPAFMAPEQCAGSADIDGRADVYALGAVLYRCLVGRAPYTGTTTQILHAHVYDPLLIPDAVANVLPAPVMQVLARAMMKEPAQRYAHVDLMAAELRAVAALPDLPATQGAPEIIDPTMTMASLPVAQNPATATSRVLVAAAPVSAPVVSRPSPIKPLPRTTMANITPPRVIPVMPPTPARSRSRQGRGLLVIIGIVAVLMMVLGSLFVNSMLPEVDDAANGDATATRLAVAGDSTPEAPLRVDGPAANVTGTPVSSELPATEPGEPTPAASPTVAGTPTPIPTPSVSLPFAWDLAQSFFEDGDWDSAVTWLNVVRRIVEGDDPLRAVDVDAGEQEIDQQRLEQMLVLSYIGLATDAAAAGRWEEAIDQMNQASELDPTATLYSELVAGLNELAELQDQNEPAAQERRKTLLTGMADRLSLYAEQLQAESRVCDAVLLVENAIQIAVSETLQEHQRLLSEQCENATADDAILAMGGTILYSSGGAGTAYNIWRLPVDTGALTTMASSLLIANAAQPQLSPNGSLLAYYSRQQGQDGLYAIRTSGLAALGSAERYGVNPEDSRDSPPSWDLSSSQVAYSTSRGDEAARIYVAAAAANSVGRDLGFGKDPAWRPGYDVLVFNGPDVAGQHPGLRAMSASGDGSDRYALTGTLNGNDQRPTWSPDGNYVVFMSKDREGGDSWEVYRLNWQSGEIILLTDGNPGQDGLPAVSPDGQWVVFMSDRGGRWNLWYVSIDGGPIHFLSEISGQPIAWLEHSLQWVR